MSLMSKSKQYTHMELFIVMHEILELPYLSEEIKNDYSFQIIVVWSQDLVKLCKMSFLLNSTKAIKDTSITYRESLIHACKIWIEYNRPTSNIDERSKTYKVTLHWLFLKLEKSYMKFL